MQIPWVKVLTNFVWIVGTALILAAFSYHDYLAHMEKTRLKEVLRRKSFLWPGMLGSILITGGVAASVRSPLLSTVFAGGAFLIIALIKKIGLAHRKSRFISQDNF